MKAVIAIALLALLGCASAANRSEDEYKFLFKAWMNKYDKKYADDDVEHRFTVFKTNLDYIESFNQAGVYSHRLAMNEFGDMTNDEFRAKFLGTRKTVSGVKASKSETVGLPESVDWTKKGAVTAIKNQGQCGSCWSFSTTGSVEGAHFLATGNLVSLSEQQLVDCSGSYGNMGCNGGLMDDAFQYIIQKGGLDTEESYPYTAEDGSCHFKASDVAATISSYKDVKQGDEGDLQTHVAAQPVSVAIDASHNSFQFYSSGVYNEPDCSSEQLDHGVLAVGYGSDSGSDYWLVKNSWGTSWGQEGYIWMSRNKDNQCGIATSASVPIV